MDIILGPILSVFSVKFYRKIAQSPVWKGFLYIALLSLIAAVLLCFAFDRFVLPEIDNFARWFADNMPEIDVTAEGISSRVEQPFEMIHPNLGKIFTMDTRIERVEFEDMKDSYVFATRTNIYVRSGENEYRVYNIRETVRARKRGADETFKITRDFLLRIYRSIVPWVLPVVFVAVLMYVFIYKLIAAFVYSLSGLLLNRFKKERLKYAGLFNISCFAITPVFILQMIGFIIPGFNVPWPLGISLTIAYIALALFG